MTMMTPATMTSAAHSDVDAIAPVPDDAVRAERRGSRGRSRARDRLLDRGSQPTAVPAGGLAGVRDIENMLLFIDDDLRETALAMTRIEEYLSGVLMTLELPAIRREHVRALASDTRVLDHVDQLSETLESLRRRLAKLSTTMR